MPLVKAQCPNCSGILDIDNSKEAAICPFCNTPYIVEKAIINNITNNNYEIQNAEIKITGEDIEKMLKDAYAYFQLLNDTVKAKEKFLEITNRFPTDYRAWWGLVEVETDNFKSLNYSRSAVEYYEKAIAVASHNIRETLVQKFEPYYVLVKKRNDIMLNTPASESNNNRIHSDITLSIIFGVPSTFVMIICFVMILIKDKLSADIKVYLFFSVGILIASICLLIDGILYVNKRKRERIEKEKSLEQITKIEQEIISLNIGK